MSSVFPVPGRVPMPRMSTRPAVKQVIEQRQREPRMGMALRGDSAAYVDLEILAEALDDDRPRRRCCRRATRRGTYVPVPTFLQLDQLLFSGCFRCSPVSYPASQHCGDIPFQMAGQSARRFSSLMTGAENAKAGKKCRNRRSGSGSMLVQSSGVLDLGHGYYTGFDRKNKRRNSIEGVVIAETQRKSNCSEVLKDGTKT